MKWVCRAQHSTGWIADVCKLNVVALKRPDRPRKTWDEVLVNDRKKLALARYGFCVLSEEDAFEEDLSNRPQPSVEENRALKWI